MSQAYRKVRSTQDKPNDPNEVRITKRKPMSNYAKYVLSQFTERGATSVTLRQMGKNVDTIVSVAEIVKYRVKGLYQVNHIGTQVFEDVFEPLEEGLDTLRFKRYVSYVTITLSKDEPKEKGYGFQRPIDESLVNENEQLPRGPQREGGRGGRRGDGNRRGGRGPRPYGGEERADRPERSDRQDRGDRPPRRERPEGAFNERGDRTEREGAGEGRGRGVFRGQRGGRRGGRGAFGGAVELVPGTEGRPEIRPYGGPEGERRPYRGNRGGFRGERREDGGYNRPPRFPREEGAYNRPQGERRFEGYNSQRGGERRGGAPRGTRGGPRPSTRGGEQQQQQQQ